MKPLREGKSSSENYDVKHRNYLIQQEKLRHMGQSTFANKSLDADSMIENLLSRSETFMKNKETNEQGLPSWLNCNSSCLPKIYKNIWMSVKSKNITGAQQFCDTQLLTSILLTSGIPTDHLGFIWGLCNKTVPGMLTEQELYNILALIALAQLGRPWNNLKFLQNVEEPVIPYLNYNLLCLNASVMNPGIHSTYFPNAMAMSIPSPIQMFQNTTNTVASNNSVSLELNASLLETMLSNNLQPTALSAASSKVPSSNMKVESAFSSSWKEGKNDLADNWTDFIDHTANSQQQSIVLDPAVKKSELPSNNYSTLVPENDSRLAFDDEPKSVFESTSHSLFKNLSKSDFENSSKSVFNSNPGPMCEKNVSHIFENDSQLPFNCNTACTAFENSSKSVFENSEKSVFDRDTQLITENITKSVVEQKKKSSSNNFNPINFYDSTLSGLSTVVVSDSKSEPVFVDNFTSNFSKLTIDYNSTAISKNEKMEPSTDDEFTDFQSFDFPKSVSVSKTNFLETSDLKVKKNDSLFDYNADNSEISPKKDQFTRDIFLSSENDESLSKGFVVENPLYLSDNDSIYDNNSVSSLKFDSFSIDMDTNLGLNLFSSKVSTSLTDKTGSNLNADKQNKPLEIQVPCAISANTLEDKYSVFRILETQEISAFNDTKNNDDDFGDFLTADTNLPPVTTITSEEIILDNSSTTLFSEPFTKSINSKQDSLLDYAESLSVQEECTNICIAILKEAVRKFSSLSSNILKLVLCEDKCIDYIQDLVQIYHVAERMTQNMSYGPNGKNLSDVWRELNSYVSTKFSNEECDEENDYSCTLCNTNSGPAVIKYGTAHYHLPCINFYLNCVNSNLPY